MRTPIVTAAISKIAGSRLFISNITPSVSLKVGPASGAEANSGLLVGSGGDDVGDAAMICATGVEVGIGIGVVATPGVPDIPLAYQIRYSNGEPSGVSPQICFWSRTNHTTFI